MSSGVTIPDDVRVALAASYVKENFDSGEPWSMTIARAILAERQRCADVARRYLEDIAGCSMTEDEPERIARAVMEGRSD